MFDQLLATLESDVETIKAVLKVNEDVRAAVFASISNDSGAGNAAAAAASPTRDVGSPWAEIIATAPKRFDWHIFDHCACFTRLYAVYEQYVTELVTEFLEMLPQLHPAYGELDLSVRTQHRVAVGQILQKWSERGPFGHLTERAVLRGLAVGLNGEANYSLLPDAFLIDPQNYRAETIGKIFGYLGFADCWAGIRKYHGMVRFIAERRDATETAETILRDIVEYRNGASHTNISDVVSADEINSYADFIVVLAHALADLLKRRVLRQRLSLGHAAPIGTIIKVFGRVVGARMEQCTLAIGDELIVSDAEGVRTVSVLSIGRLAERFERTDVKAAEEIGLGLDGQVDLGSVLLRLAVPETTMFNAQTSGGISSCEMTAGSAQVQANLESQPPADGAHL